MLTVTRDASTLALTHRDLDVVDYRGRYESLGRHLGVDFAATIAAFDMIPLALRGNLHAQARIEAGRFIASRRSAVVGALPEIVNKNLAVLATPGRHDFLNQALIPCIDATVSAIIGMEIGLPRDSLISRLFSQSMGIAKRRRLNEEIAELRGRIDTEFPADAPSQNGLRVALSILGRDALIGTVALSLRSHFDTLSGSALREMSLPTVPTHTGVPYVDREAQQTTSLVDQHLGKGEQVRVDLASHTPLPDAERMRFFGAGPHVCLGRPLSMELMKAISFFCSEQSARVSVVTFELRKDDVFSIPSQFEIEVR